MISFIDPRHAKMGRMPYVASIAMVQPAHLAVGHEAHNETTKLCATAQTGLLLREPTRHTTYFRMTRLEKYALNVSKENCMPKENCMLIKYVNAIYFDGDKSKRIINKLRTQMI